MCKKEKIEVKQIEINNMLVSSADMLDNSKVLKNSQTPALYNRNSFVYPLYNRHHVS